MIPNDYWRCQGTLAESYETDGQIYLYTHPQCLNCRRRTDVEPDRDYPRQDPPLGLLADADALCEWRIGE